MHCRELYQVLSVQAFSASQVQRVQVAAPSLARRKQQRRREARHHAAAT